jgi:hypothetical protein
MELFFIRLYDTCLIKHRDSFPLFMTIIKAYVARAKAYLAPRRAIEAQNRFPSVSRRADAGLGEGRSPGTQ